MARQLMPNGPANGCPRSRSGKRPRAALMAGAIHGARSSQNNGVTRPRAGSRARRRWASTERRGDRRLERRTWLGTFGSGPAAVGRRVKKRVWFGAVLGATIVASPPARIAASDARSSAAAATGFVVPGHSVTLYPFPCYAIYSVNRTLWVQGEGLPKIFGLGRAVCR